MTTLASVRDLRNRFPRIKKQLEAGSEVVLTERGKPRYRLTLFIEDTAGRAAPSKDYLERLKRHQPRPLSKKASRALHEENRGDR
jgi:antitoxin (DNA-binding transcriptional repressor) of toxin-antitoxin stability system